MYYIKPDLNHIFEELGKELQSINIERFVSLKEAELFHVFLSISNHFISCSLYKNDMTKFSTSIIKCIDGLISTTSKCGGNSNCLDECTQHPRNRLDNVFLPSKSIDLECDKINYFFPSYILNHDMDFI